MLRTRGCCLDPAVQRWGTMHPIPKDKWRSVEIYNPATKAWEPLTEMPKVEQDSTPPEPGSVLVFDEEGNLIAGRAVLEEIVASGKTKLVLVEFGNFAE